MGKGEKIASGIIAIAMVTTLILPKRKTADVIDAFTGLFTGTLKTAMATD